MHQEGFLFCFVFAGGKVEMGRKNRTKKVLTRKKKKGKLLKEGF